MTFKALPLRLMQVFLLALIATITLGCGSSNDYNPSGGLGTGDVTFSFVPSVLTQSNLPAGTTSVGFRFYEGLNLTTFPLSEAWTPTPATYDYAPQITVEDVSILKTYVLVTLYGQGGIPLAYTVSPTHILPSQNNLIDLSSATFTAIQPTSLTAKPSPLEVQVGASVALTLSASFDNGEEVTLPASAYSLTGLNPTIASFDADTGSIKGVTPGATSFVAHLDGIASAEVPVTVTTGFSLNYSELTLANDNSTSGALIALFQEQDVTDDISLTFNSFGGGLSAADLSYNDTTHTFSTVDSPAAGGTALATITYQNAGTSYSAIISITVDTPANASKIISGEFTSTTQQSVKISSGSRAPLFAKVTRANQVTSLARLNPSDSPDPNLEVGTSADSDPIVTFDAPDNGGGTTYQAIRMIVPYGTASGKKATVELRTKGSSAKVLDTLSLEVIVATHYTLTVNFAADSVKVDESIPYTVTLTYDGGLGTIDLTNLVYPISSGVSIAKVAAANPISGVLPGFIEGVAAGTATFSGPTLPSPGFSSVLFTGEAPNDNIFINYAGDPSTIWATPAKTITVSPAD